MTHHEPVLGVGLSGGWSEKRVDAREAELGLALMAAGGRVRDSGQLSRGGARVRVGKGGGGSEGAQSARNREMVERGRRIPAGGASCSRRKKVAGGGSEVGLGRQEKRMRPRSTTRRRWCGRRGCPARGHARRRRAACRDHCNPCNRSDRPLRPVGPVRLS